MVKSSVKIQETVDFLNSLLTIDRVVITALFSVRISCNKDMADHPTVQVGAEGNYYQVGMIGILNGLFGSDKNGWGHISAEYDNGTIKNFSLLSNKDVENIIKKNK